MLLSRRILLFTSILYTSMVFAEPIKLTETVLPLEFNTGNPAPYGLPSTTIKIEGKSLLIIIDTGAKKTEITLSPYALKNIHIKYTGKIICFNAFDGRHCEKEFIIPAVQLGNFVIKNVKGISMSKLWGGNDDGFKSTEASRNGVIGYALLAKFNVLLDYAHSKAILVKPGFNPAQYNVKKWSPVSFDEHLRTKLNLNGKVLTFTWDTGAIPSGISRSMANNFKQSLCPKNNPYEGESNKCVRVETTSLRTMNNEALPDTWFNVADIPSFAPFDGLIGSNFYADNLVYFDFDNHKIYVKPTLN